jgi:hypothetical protein
MQMKLSTEESQIAKIFSYHDQIKYLGLGMLFINKLESGYEVSFIFKSKGVFHTYASSKIKSLYEIPHAESEVLPSQVSIGINNVPLALEGMSQKEYFKCLESNVPVITKLTLVEML